MEPTTASTQTKWSIDPAHSHIGFKVKHLMFTNVRGTFSDYGATIQTTGDDFMTARVEFWVNPASVNTHDEKRDGHVRGADFFDVEHFQRITFTATNYEKTEKEEIYALFGDLTIKGITKRISLQVEFGGIMKDPWGKDKAALNVAGKIHRKDWGLNWNAPLEGGGMLVSDDVTIDCEIQLLKQA